MSDPTIAEAQALRVALDNLQAAEQTYRKMHDLHGDGAIQAGMAWDVMRRAGDKARTVLALPQHEPAREHGDGRAEQVLADIVPLSISSTWDESEKRCIIRAMRAFATHPSDAPSIPAGMVASDDNV